MFSAWLLAEMEEADRLGEPLEWWTADSFESLVSDFRKHQAELRNETSGGAPEHAAQKKAYRKHLRRCTDEATKFAQRLGDMLKSERTRDRALIAVREWRKAAPNLSRADQARKLLELLQPAPIEVPSDSLTRGVLTKIERAEFQTEGVDWPTAKGEAVRLDKQGQRVPVPWALELMPQGEEDRRRQLFPATDLDAKVRQSMDAYARSLGDRDSDLMAAAMFAFIDQAKHPDDRVPLHIDNLMLALGYSKHASGSGGLAYRERDKTAVRNRLESLQNGYLTVRGIGRTAGGKVADMESRVLVIYDRIGQADLDGRVEDWTHVSIGFGRAWSHSMFTDQGRLTALLQAAALSYDARKELQEKRILKRLSFFWRMNDQKDRAEFPMQQWIAEHIGHKPETYKRRDAERLEDAFNRLRADGQISDWSYADSAPMIKGANDLPKGWLGPWLKRRLWVGIPEALRIETSTRRQAKAPPAPVEPTIDTDAIGPRVKERRITLGLSGLALAARLGLDNTALSRIENGKRRPTDEQAKALLRWMMLPPEDAANDPGQRADGRGAALGVS